MFKLLDHCCWVYQKVGLHRVFAVLIVWFLYYSFIVIIVILQVCEFSNSQVTEAFAYNKADVLF